VRTEEGIVMVDNYYIPQKTPVAAPKPVNEAAVRQAVHEAVRVAIPPIYQSGHRGAVYLTINVHIHL
jgi:hypothetical protein